MEDIYYLALCKKNPETSNRLVCPRCRKSANKITGERMGLHWIIPFFIPCVASYKTVEQALGLAPWGDFVFMREYRVFITDTRVFRLMDGYKGPKAYHRAVEFLPQDKTHLIASGVIGALYEG